MSDRVDEILAAVLVSRGDKEDGTHDHLPRVLRDFLHEACWKAHLLGFNDGYAEGFGKAEDVARAEIARLTAFYEARLADAKQAVGEPGLLQAFNSDTVHSSGTLHVKGRDA